jgi:hypothetical protein
MRTSLLRHARKQRAAAMLACDYRTAERLHGAVCALSELEKAASRWTDDVCRADSLRARLAAAEARRKALEERWRAALAALAEQRQQSLASVKQRHEADVREFRARWDEPATLLPFQKPSVALLQVRRMQKAFALANEFADARVMRASGERICKEEVEGATKRAALAMASEYDAIVERHEREMDVWAQYWERKKAELELERDAELEVNANLRKTLGARIAEPAIGKRPHVPVGQGSASAMLTNRTRQMIVDYRVQSEATPLDVRPASVRKVVRLKPKTKRKEKQGKEHK